MDRRIRKINFKVSQNERIQLWKIVEEQKQSLSDVIRHAIRSTYNVTGFNPSYEMKNKSVFENKRKRSIYDFKEW